MDGRVNDLDVTDVVNLDDSGLFCLLDCLHKVLGSAENFRDSLTHSHEVRLALLTQTLAEHIGIGSHEAHVMGAAARFHDIGKFGVAEDLLNRPGPLSLDEVEAVKRHCQMGHDILTHGHGEVTDLAAVIALHHHERFDGTGYPNRLSGDQIPLPAAIVALCDVYDAVRSDRPYKDGCDHQTACDIILKGDGRTAPEHFHPQVLEAFRSIMDQFAAIHDGQRMMSS